MATWLSQISARTSSRSVQDRCDVSDFDKPEIGRKASPAYNHRGTVVVAIGWLALYVIAAIADSPLGMAGASAVAQPTASSRLCAARDLEVVVLIEDHGAANDIASERLAKAFLTQMDARVACSGGRTEEGIALYNNVFRALGSMLSRRQ
jgi:hypothetical protein